MRHVESRGFRAGCRIRALWNSKQERGGVPGREGGREGGREAGLAEAAVWFETSSAWGVRIEGLIGFRV